MSRIFGCDNLIKAYAVYVIMKIKSMKRKHQISTRKLTFCVISRYLAHLADSVMYLETTRLPRNAIISRMKLTEGK